MVDIVKPLYGEVWAATGEKLVPDLVKINLGWIQEMMPFQYENWIQNRQDVTLTYLLQKGVAEWTVDQEYIGNKSVVTYQGNLYMSTATSTGVFPTNTGQWKRLSSISGADGVISVGGGGTGATTAADARVNLGLGTISTQNSTAVSITGGTINGTPIGATTRSTGAFTSVNVTGDVTAATFTGSFIGNLTGNAATATLAATPRFSTFLSGVLTSDYNSANTGGLSASYGPSNALNKPPGLDHSVLSLSYVAGTGTTVYQSQYAHDWRTNVLHLRAVTAGVPGVWKAVAFTDSNITGSAASAAQLTTARTIALSGGATGTATSFDGTANITIPITSLNAAMLVGVGAIDVTGNAATATKLATPVTINNVPFDGSSGIIVADATKLPLVGGTLTGPLTGTTSNFTTSITSPIGFISNIRSATRIITNNLTGSAIGVGVGDLLVSGTYSDSSLVPTQGAYIKGDVVSGGIFTGNGSGLTNINGSTITNIDGSSITTGTIPAARIPVLNQSTTGNAATATTLQTARTIAISGAATGTPTPFNGAGNISIPITELNATNLLTGTVPTGRLDNAVTKTGPAASAVIPSGTSLQRDVSPQPGYTRFNSTLGLLEFWNGSTWITPNGTDLGGLIGTGPTQISTNMMADERYATAKDYPLARPALLLDFANSERADSRITVTRAGVATRINSLGQVELVPENVARINYDAATGECLGLLVEGLATNGVIQSEFGNGLSGVTFGGGVTATTFPGFAGGASVQKAAGDSYVYKSATTTSGTSYTFSFIVEMDDGGVPSVSLATSSDFMVVMYGGAHTGSITVTKQSGSKYLVQAVSVAQSSSVNYGVVKYAAQSNRGFKVTAYDRQQGTAPTSYIPTTTAPVTRNPDIVQMLGNNFTSWYRPEGGTFVVQGSRSNLAGTIIGLGSTETSTRMSIYGLQPNIQLLMNGQAQVQVQVMGQGTAVGATDKVAFAMAVNDFAYVKNGGQVGYDTEGLVSQTGNPFNRLHIGSATWSVPGADYLNGHIRNISYYASRLTATQLQLVTQL